MRSRDSFHSPSQRSCGDRHRDGLVVRRGCWTGPCRSGVAREDRVGLGHDDHGLGLERGQRAAAGRADETGHFVFTNLESGTYAVELVSETDKILTVGHTFAIAPGETVATFVRLGTKTPWFAEFFGNAAGAVTAVAASQGITTLAPVQLPASPR